MEGGKSPATRNRTRDHLIAATLYSQMLYQLSYSRICLQTYTGASLHWDPIAIWAALKTDQPRHEARVNVRTISLVAWSTGPRFDWAVYVCVRTCVCVFACVAAMCRFRCNVEDSRIGGTKRLSCCRCSELLAYLVIRDCGEGSGFVLLLASRQCQSKWLVGQVCRQI